MIGSISSRLRRCVAVAALAAAAAFAAGPQARAEDDAPKYSSDLTESDGLTGDWGGARTKLQDKGVTFDATFTGDFSINPSGGIKRGKGFSGLLQIGLGLDLEKLVGWTGGELYAGAYIIRGNGLTTNELGNLLTMSNIEFDRGERLAEIYFKQSLFDDVLTIKVGQLAADGDFVTSDTAGLFVNSTFGWPGLMGVNLPSGGPAYPVPTPGVHAAVKFNEQLSFQAGLYNGDPAGRNDINDHNLGFPINDGAFAIGELIYETDSGLFGLPGVYKAGAWYNSLHFDDLRFAKNGLELDDPLADDPRRNDGAYAIYGVIDQTVWRSGGSTDLKDPTPSPEQNVSVFARGVWAPQEDRNLIDVYLDAGFNLKGFTPGRPDDVFGVAAAYAHISRDFQKLDPPGGPKHSAEVVIEASYKAQLLPSVALQPFAQYVSRPGGGDEDPRRPGRRIKDATVLGFRTQVTF